MQNLSLAWCALHCIHTHLAVSEQSQIARNPVLDQRQQVESRRVRVGEGILC